MTPDPTQHILVFMYPSRDRVKKIITAGRLKCCDMEDCTVVAYDCRKTKNLICGMEGKIVVAYGRLPPQLLRV